MADWSISRDQGLSLLREKSVDWVSKGLSLQAVARAEEPCRAAPEVCLREVAGIDPLL